MELWLGYYRINSEFLVLSNSRNSLEALLSYSQILQNIMRENEIKNIFIKIYKTQPNNPNYVLNKKFNEITGMYIF